MNSGALLRFGILFFLVLTGTTCSTRHLSESVAQPGPTAPNAPDRFNAQRIWSEPAWIHIRDEELSQFNSFIAFSDIHAHLRQLEDLFIAHGLARRQGPEGNLHWVGKKTLVIGVGDYIDKGPDSIGTVLLLDRLRNEAPATGSRIILLLGNHEAEFLSDPRKEPNKEQLKELIENANQPKYASILNPRERYGPNLKATELRESYFGDILRSFPVGAVIGRRLFLHAGNLLDTSEDALGPRALLDRAQVSYQRLIKLREKQTLELSNSGLDALLQVHGSWKKPEEKKNQRMALQELNLFGMVMGHEPGVLEGEDVEHEIAKLSSGWLLKLDTGMGDASDDKANNFAKILKCHLTNKSIISVSPEEDFLSNCKVGTLTSDRDESVLNIFTN